ncbi:MAG: multidrug transporter AcrB [Rhizobiales bacterium NRL2]|jgi:multidrug efflux pump|nr:MAG: multidrug transporter AcrB [Rhizobiales bacterium NRL2]
MVLSDTAIKRPVFAIVISLVLMIFGAFSYEKMSVREYPDIDPPIVSVNTIWRGASANIVESQITQVLEDELAGIGGVKRIASTSREGSSSISVEFNLSRDIDAAANDVRDRVSRALNRLPVDAEQPTVAKSESDARAMMWMVLSSDRMNAMELTDYAERQLIDRFSVVDGVSRVRTGGGKRFAMRIWLKKNELAARGLTVTDVEAALREQNIDLPSGRIESVTRELSVRTETSLETVEQFRNIVLAERDGYVIRLMEVADVALGPEDERTEFRSNGQTTVGVGVIRQSKANTLEVARGVREELAKITPGLPEGMTLDLSYDESVFIEESIEEVYRALVIALGLVVLVIFVFLRSITATIIPVLAIPVSILAAFIVLSALDYSVNVLTLLALVLAIGLVVDDAIVVLENIHRRIEDGEQPLLAALRGARQIAFAVIATTIVLIAVFVPISFLEGNVGRLFREFGIAVAVAVMFSSFIALTLTPMLCSKLLRPSSQSGWFGRVTEKGFKGLSNGYKSVLTSALKLPIVVIALAGVVSAMAYLFYLALPQELAPQEDRGIIFVSATAPEGASLEFTSRYVAEVEDKLMPLIEEGIGSRVLVILAPGFGGRPGDVNVGFGILRLVPWEEREVSQQEVIGRLFPQVLAVPGVKAFAFGRPPLGQRFSQTPVQFVIGGPDYDVLERWATLILDKARENPGILNPDMSYDQTLPELRVDIDRDRAADLGVRIDNIGRTLETMLGERRVTTFQQGGKQYDVILRAQKSDRSSPRDLRNIYVRSGEGGSQLIPLESLVTLSEGVTARELERTDRLRSVTITASLAPGYTLGEALAFLDRVAAEELPPEARVTYAGESDEFKSSSSALYLTFALALVIVFLALAAQFESFIHPFVILTAVPLAVTGALATMLATGISINVYSQIGLIMLIGLTAKNAILIVEFANQLRDEGEEIREAVIEASAIRLRPILMTTISTGLGALPLALATGAGSETRATLGIVIIGGIGFSTILSLFIVPQFYLLLARFTKPVGHVERMLNRQEREDREGGDQPAVPPVPAAE